MDIQIKSNPFFKGSRINGIHIQSYINGVECSSCGFKVRGSKLRRVLDLHDQLVDRLNATSDLFSENPNRYEIVITYWSFDIVEGEKTETITGSTTLSLMEFDHAMHMAHQLVKQIRPWSK